MRRPRPGPYIAVVLFPAGSTGMVSRGEIGVPGLSRRAIVLLTVMAAISVACSGVVWAQDSGRTLKPGSASQQSAESSVIPGRYIVVLEDDGGGETAAWASV